MSSTSNLDLEAPESEHYQSPASPIPEHAFGSPKPSSESTSTEVETAQNTEGHHSPNSDHEVGYGSDSSESSITADETPVASTENPFPCSYPSYYHGIYSHHETYFPMWKDAQENDYRNKYIKFLNARISYLESELENQLTRKEAKIKEMQNRIDMLEAQVEGETDQKQGIFDKLDELESMLDGQIP
ncbi:hypothetical protein P170DRAFT_481209 [Aspergillus steynii IBT 23096]|uniref:Uncharacterized protein n=1 Tax=Aspergillus steynii IBT 23096 TaxID=1392250 RepID=A0A2I2FRJ4_9EURO|nr:uncharacterized protein P170DRAFT_481209 [Aspergillus steynii IBT 23096]PLB43258.1 hypothetical protein P170DRAFT_481209 [Aspergillus steynii IBT 23096]